MGDVADLTAKAYEIARMIPSGRVTTYGRFLVHGVEQEKGEKADLQGHIAKLAGYPNYSRHVGGAMKMLPSNSDIPWQRVISSKGVISPRGDDGQGVARQKAVLESEGVEVVTLAGGGGEKVDMRTYGWFPEEVQLA